MFCQNPCTVILRLKKEKKKKVPLATQLEGGGGTKKELFCGFLYGYRKEPYLVYINTDPNSRSLVVKKPWKNASTNQQAGFHKKDESRPISIGSLYTHVKMPNNYFFFTF